jgi:hypothetical protein
MNTYEDKIQYTDGTGSKKRATVKFQKIQPNVDAVSGFMMQNRSVAKYTARMRATPEQSLFSRNMNALYSYHRENSSADQVESEQDTDMLICGYGATETDLSYLVGNSTTSPNGEILKMRLDPLKVGWDPKASGKNIKDAGWAYYFFDYKLSDALDLFDNSKEEDFETVDQDETDDIDRGYTYNPYGGVYDKIKADDTVEWSNKEEEMVRVYNHQWFTYERFYKAKNPLHDVTNEMDARFMLNRLELIKSEIKDMSPKNIDAGDMFDFDPMAEEFTFDEATKRKLTEEFGNLIDPIPFTRKAYYTAIFSGEHLFGWFRSISQQGFSIKFKTGSYSAEYNIYIGMVNSMMEPQKYYNKAITEFMFTIASLSKGGVLIERDAVEDISDFEDKYAKTDGVIVVEPGAIAGGKIQPKQQAMLPSGLDAVVDISALTIAENGVDPAFVGNREGQESGILYKRRIRQVISKMAKYFDAVVLYQKDDARQAVDLIRVWIENNAGQWVRVTGEDGADEFKQISEDMLAGEYDVTTQESAQTPEDKEETAKVLGLYGDKLIMTDPASAKTFYAESVGLLPIDGDIKERLVEALQPKEQMVPLAQVEELQQQIQALQSEAAQANLRKVNSDAALNEAKAQTESVNQVETLESTKNKALENDLIITDQYDKVNVSI